MYLKQGQLMQIKDAIKEIHGLVSMENCDLDAETKEKIRLWVMWFDVYAYQIENALDGEVKEKYR